MHDLQAYYAVRSKLPFLGWSSHEPGVHESLQAKKGGVAFDVRPSNSLSARVSSTKTCGRVEKLQENPLTKALGLAPDHGDTPPSRP